MRGIVDIMRTLLHRAIFCSFSRPRAQGKPQLKVKVRILKILKLRILNFFKILTMNELSIIDCLKLLALSLF